MRTIAKTSPPSDIEPQFVSGLHFALGNMAESVADRVSSAIAEQIQTRKVNMEVIRQIVTSAMPSTLESEFVRELLDDKEDSRKRRAMLVHVLSAADVRGINANVAMMQDVAPATVEDDELLTSQDAAKLLHVSRTHMNMLIDTGKLGAVSITDGGHRRIARSVVLAHKKRAKARQVLGLAEMVGTSARLGLYAGEIANTPRRAKG